MKSALFEYLADCDRWFRAYHCLLLGTRRPFGRRRSTRCQFGVAEAGSYRGVVAAQFLIVRDEANGQVWANQRPNTTGRRSGRRRYARP